MDENSNNSETPRIRDLVRFYWRLHGGWSDFFTSRYLWLSILILVPTFHTWSNSLWWELPIGVLPNILGFSLGGYAILLSFGDDRFKRLLVSKTAEEEQKQEPSQYLKVSAVFLHFILMQGLALLIAVIARGLAFSPKQLFGGHLANHPITVDVLAVGRYVFWGFGFWLFIYAIVVALAAALSVFHLSKLFDEYQRFYADFLKGKERERERKEKEQQQQERRQLPPSA